MPDSGNPENPPPENGADAVAGAGEYTEQGLPAISPDTIEQDFAEDMDDIVPSHGYEMLPMVALGGSAGSIPALQKFFSVMPPDSGMAFAVIMHLSAEHESVLDELLGRTTRMPVVQAEDQQKVQANTVYVIPPGKFLTLTNGHLKLTDIDAEQGKRVTVDLFFRTLADTH